MRLRIAYQEGGRANDRGGIYSRRRVIGRIHGAIVAASVGAIVAETGCHVVYRPTTRRLAIAAGTVDATIARVHTM